MTVRITAQQPEERICGKVRRLKFDQESVPVYLFQISPLSHPTAPTEGRVRINYDFIATVSNSKNPDTSSAAMAFSTSARASTVNLSSKTLNTSVIAKLRSPMR